MGKSKEYGAYPGEARMKALLVILNKDNASALEKCLSSVAKMEGLCEKFDVLILDGASKDNSREVAQRYTTNYPCMKFKVQKKLGGTGFARREACEYAYDNGYDIVIWGDSENEYSPKYIEHMLGKLKTHDAVGGVPKVRGGFYAHAFAWYHALHLVIPSLYKYHIPGNNKGEKTKIYQDVEYPATVRSEDYGFSLLLRKKGISLKQTVAKNAFVKVSLPERWKDIKAWQRARAKGVAQVLVHIDEMPWDNFACGFIVLLFFIFGIIAIWNILPLVVYSVLYFSISLWIFAKSLKYIEKPKTKFFIAPAIGVIIYSLYSLYALIMFWKIKKQRKT